MFNSKQERVIQLVAAGLSNKDVALGVGLTEHVVKNYLRTIYDELGFWNRTELAMWYVKRSVEAANRGEKLKENCL